MRRSLMLLASLSLAVVLVACGSSSSSSSDKGQEYVDAMMKSYDNSSGSTKDIFSRSQAECVSEGVVDSVGVDTLEEAGVSPDDLGKSSDGPFDTIGQELTEQQAEDLVSVLTDGKCFDFTDLVMKQVSSAGGSPFAKLGEAKTRCLFEALLSNPAFKQAMADSILGKSSSNDAFSNAFKNQSEIFDIFSKCDIKPSEISG